MKTANLTVPIEPPNSPSAAAAASETSKAQRKGWLSANAVRLLAGSLPFLLHGLALAVAAGPSAVLPDGLSLAALLVAPPLYVLALVTAAGLVGRSMRRWIIAGRFERDPATPLYRGRLLYGAAWTTVFYCKPVFHAVLGLPPLKRWTLRLFGYRGDLSFTTYPDAWIRDLPLLDIGKGVYISNRATLGTNIVQNDGRILVGGIKLAERVLIGHLAMIAPGCDFDEGTEIGVGCAVGMMVKTGKRVHVAPSCTINHAANLGDGVEIGTMCLIGRRVTIAPGLKIPSGSVIPDRVRLETQADVERYAVRRGA